MKKTMIQFVGVMMGLSALAMGTGCGGAKNAAVDDCVQALHLSKGVAEAGCHEGVDIAANFVRSRIGDIQSGQSETIEISKLLLEEVKGMCRAESRKICDQGVESALARAMSAPGMSCNRTVQQIASGETASCIITVSSASNVDATTAQRLRNEDKQVCHGQANWACN